MSNPQPPDDPFAPKPEPPAEGPGSVPPAQPPAPGYGQPPYGEQPAAPQSPYGGQPPAPLPTYGQSYAGAPQYPAAPQYPPAPPSSGAPQYPAAPQYGQYGATPYGAVYPKNQLGVWALVLGIASFVLSCGLFTGIPAIILGRQGQRAADTGEANNRGLSTAGVVLGWIAVGLSAVAIVVGIIVAIVAISNGSSSY